MVAHFYSATKYASDSVPELKVIKLTFSLTVAWSLYIKRNNFSHALYEKRDCNTF